MIQTILDFLNRRPKHETELASACFNSPYNQSEHNVKQVNNIYKYKMHRSEANHLVIHVLFPKVEPPETCDRPAHHAHYYIRSIYLLMRALTSNHTLIRRWLDRGQIEVVLKIFQMLRYVNLKIYNFNEQETTE